MLAVVNLYILTYRCCVSHRYRRGSVTGTPSNNKITRGEGEGELFLLRHRLLSSNQQHIAKKKGYNADIIIQSCFQQ